MTDDKLVMKKMEDMLPTDSFTALIINETPIPGIRPAGNLKTYHTALVSNHLVEIHMDESRLAEKPPAGVIGSFEVTQGTCRFRLDEALWKKFEIDKVTLLFTLKPE